MDLNNKKIGFAITGSCCNFKEVKSVIESLKDAGVKEILPIVSYSTKNSDFLQALTPPRAYFIIILFDIFF